MDTKEKRQGTPTRRPREEKQTGKRPVRRKPALNGTEKTAPKGKAPGAAPTKKRTPKPASQPAPEVVYTQPGAFNRNRFLLRLATVVAVVLALVFGISIFFKVGEVRVSGNEKYEIQEIVDASCIRTGDNLIGLNEAKIVSNIRARLPYVDRIRVGIKLPDTVNIEITELDVVYAIGADDGSWWLMRADGGIVEKTGSAEAELHTKVEGVQITAPEVGKKAVAAQPVTDETLPDGQPVPVTISAQDQLDAAISILQCLEDQSILGQMTSVNVSNLNDLQLWYGTRYQITLGDVTNLVYKIRSMNAAIAQMGDYESGILDVSYTTWPDKVGYTPFD